MKDRMCRGARRAKALCMVLIVLEAVKVVLSFSKDFAGTFGLSTGASVTAIIALLLIRWLFDALESIITLLCPAEQGAKLPEAAFPRDKHE